MHHEMFIGRVVSVNDPDKAGRVQIRIYGIHDNSSSLPNEQLPWARCVFPVTNPIHKGTSGPTTGIIVNSTVVGYFVDPERQIPLVTGTIGASSSDGTDFPQADRGSDHNDVLAKSLPSIGASSAKYLAERTIGNIAYTGQEIDQLLGQIGAGNIIGSIKSGLSIVKNFENLKNNLVNATIGNLNNMVQGFVSDISSGIENEIGGIINTSPLGNVINLTSSLENWHLSLFNPASVVSSVESQVGELSGLADTINHFAGNIATRTSKLPINNVTDAVSRLNGFRFVMGGVMTNLESSLNSMLEL